MCTFFVHLLIGYSTLLNANKKPRQLLSCRGFSFDLFLLHFYETVFYETQVNVDFNSNLFQ